MENSHLEFNRELLKRIDGAHARIQQLIEDLEVERNYRKQMIAIMADIQQRHDLLTEAYSESIKDFEMVSTQCGANYAAILKLDMAFSGKTEFLKKLETCLSSESQKEVNLQGYADDHETI